MTATRDPAVHCETRGPDSDGRFPAEDRLELASRREFLVQTASGAAVALGIIVSVAGLAAASGHPPQELRVFSKQQAGTWPPTPVSRGSSTNTSPSPMQIP